MRGWAGSLVARDGLREGAGEAGPVSPGGGVGLDRLGIPRTTRAVAPDMHQPDRGGGGASPGDDPVHATEGAVGESGPAVLGRQEDGVDAALVDLLGALGG